MPMRSAPTAAFLALVALFALGCERPPSASDLREWAPADHDRAEEESAQANRPVAPAGAGNGDRGERPERAERGAADAGGPETLVEITWETACAPCHGPAGHGDGPNGPMVNAPDITREDLLSKITDEEIAAQIKNGKNRMPRFDLPDPVIRGLVARIRAMRGR